MSSIGVSSIVFVCIFGAGLLGILLRSALPDHHLTSASKDAVKVGMGLIGMMAALVLGLLVASAKGNYDSQGAAVTQVAANVAMLDRVLAHYGPETKETREVLRRAVTGFIDGAWSKGGANSAPGGSEILYEKIQELSPKDDRQRALQSQALSTVMGLGQTRWLMYEQGTTSVSMPLLVVLVLWLSLIIGSFGLFAPVNGTVITSLCVCALSVSAAIFLILEMYSPFSGMIRISSAPLQAALGLPGEMDTQIRAVKGSEVIHGKGNNPAPSHVHFAVQEGCCALGCGGRQEFDRGGRASRCRAQPAPALA